MLEPFLQIIIVVEILGINIPSYNSPQLLNLFQTYYSIYYSLYIYLTTLSNLQTIRLNFDFDAFGCSE